MKLTKLTILLASAAFAFGVNAQTNDSNSAAATAGCVDGAGSNGSQTVDKDGATIKCAPAGSTANGVGAASEVSGVSNGAIIAGVAVAIGIAAAAAGSSGGGGSSSTPSHH